MLIQIKFILILCATKSWQYQDVHWYKYDKDYQATNKAYRRLLELMRSYYEEGNVRIMELNEMRFMYEESPHYEQGYIMGEIIERYRKVIEHSQRPIKFKADNIVEIIKRVEFVEKLYFEVYHLVRMMHEIPLKYKPILEFARIEDAVKGKQIDADPHKTSLDYLWAAQAKIVAEERRRQKIASKGKKKYEQIRERFINLTLNNKGGGLTYSGKREPTRNKPFPLDYGWDFEGDW